MNSDRGHWYLITALVLGVGLGLLFSWVIAPVSLEDTQPKNLHADYKDLYRSLIARAYQANKNLQRAEARLALLGDESPAQALAAQAQRSLAEEGDQEMARILVNLSAALQRTPSPETTPSPPTQTLTPETTTAENSTPSPGSSSQTGTPEESDANGTQTEIPSPTPTATNAPPFVKEDEGKLCDPALTTPLIQVFATNADGEGIPGVEIKISWPPDRQETFFTGLKPEVDKGYADFEADMGVTYTIEMPGSGLVFPEVVIPECTSDDGDPYPGSYQIYITHPN